MYIIRRKGGSSPVCVSLARDRRLGFSENNRFDKRLLWPASLQSTHVGNLYIQP